ncbi:MAG: hypothetical protein ABIK28_08570 [Planctomycetota bacterium]
MLPIKRVALFKHGVGHFERTGTVEGDQDIVLSFKKDQMNDVLKSLTALDYCGGTFAAMGYDSEAPLARRLSELNLTLPDKRAISEFLDRVKGTRVSVVKAGNMLTGVIMGIDEVTRAVEGGTVIEAHLALLIDGKRLARIPLLEVEELEFLDEELSLDLQRLLDLLYSGLRKEQKRLVIHARGSGSRELSLSYVTEAPQWKTTYRIVLPGASEGKPLLQGWAIVDNPTEEDWKGVTLSLVAGLPISFVHDLYTPRYQKRPEVRVKEEAAVAPPVVEAGLSMSMPAAPPSGSGAFDEKCLEEEGVYGEPAGAAKRMSAPRFMAAAAGSSVEVHTRTQEVGDLFAYEITEPVDVGRGSSALVPIVQAEADLERVAFYNAEIRKKNPMTAFRFKNTTGLFLEGGPATVFEQGQYVGEAMLESMRKAEERIVPYSVELGIVVKSEIYYRREEVTRITKSGQYIYKHYDEVKITEYEFASRLDRNVTLYVDHGFEYGTRKDTPPPVEETERFWRFMLEVPAEKTTPFKVSELQQAYESIRIPGIAYEEIVQMVSDKLISGSTRKSLEAVADQAEKIRRLEEEMTKKKQELARIDKGQERLRKNIQVLGSSTEENKLRQKYVSTLSVEEDRIDKLRSDLARQEEEHQRMYDALTRFAEELEL